MKHLYHPSNRFPGGAPGPHRDASPLFQLLMQDRSKVDAGILRQGLASGWLTDPNEVGPTGLPVLLGYLGTLPAPTLLDGSGWTTQTLEENLRVPSWQWPEDGPGPLLDTVNLALDLLDRGANPWQQDPDGRDSFDQVASLMWFPVLDAMLQRPDAPSVERMAARRQTLPVMTRRGRVEETLPWLHAAVAAERSGWLKHLVRHGLDLNQRDDLGRTPVFYAQSPLMLGTLLELGADPLVVDRAGQTLSAVWASRVAQTAHLNAMNRRMQPILEGQRQNDPRAFQALHRPALYDLAVTGTKDSLITFMRANGFNASDRWVRPEDGREVSLLGHALLGLLMNAGERLATAQHLLERTEDPWFATVPGVPDVMLAWAMSGAVGDMGRAAEKWIGQRYDWPQAPGGFLAFVQDFVPAMERMMGYLETCNRVEPLAALGSGVLHALKTALDGRSEVLQGKALERWTQRVANHPLASITPLADRAHGHIRLADPESKGEPQGRLNERLTREDWSGATDAQGFFWVWRWASAGLNGVHLDPASTDALGRSFAELLDQEATVRGTTSPARAPYDTMALHAMLAVLGNGPTHLDKLDKRRPADGWDAQDPVRRAMAQVLNEGIVRLDSSLPGFEVRLRRVRERYPTLAQTIEQRALREAIDPTLGRPEARPRSRL